MLPASFQQPAAIVLLAGGLLACFFGHRMFRTVLAIYGFVLGALIASSLVGGDEMLPLIMAAGAGGIVGALIFIAAYFVAVALVGAGLGALLVQAIWARLDRDPQMAVVIAFAVLGAIGALVLQRYVIVLGTAFGGAWTTILGVLALVGDRAASTAATAGNVWILYPLSVSPERQWLIIVWLLLALTGAVVQLGFTAKTR